MPRTARLVVELLEDRATPATFGVPWLDASHLTLSFAPDGTTIGSSPSNLFQTLDTEFASRYWEREILRALQTWAVNANINIGVVADSGAPFGATGAVQGDPRFGAIRIGAETLSPNSVATSIPFDMSAGTWSGDIVLNSTYQFGMGSTLPYDLYSVLLHEAGHTLGINDNPDVDSPMFKNYLGVRTSLAATDIARLQALYGARSPDAFDQQWPNDSFDSASVLRPFRDGDARNLSIDADITTHQDVDFYRFNTRDYRSGVTIRLQTSGLSLLTARLSVYDSDHRLVSSVASYDPLNGDLVIRLDRVRGNSQYFIKVEGSAGDIFSIGGYRLQILPDRASGGDHGGDWGDGDDGDGGSPGHNHSFDTAMRLHRADTGNDKRFAFFTQGTIGSPTEADYFRFRTPGQSGDPAIPVMTVMAWAAPGSGLRPQVSVFDAQRNPVPSEILVNDNGSYTVQVRNVAANARYYVVVQSANPADPSSVGDYNMAVTFGNQAVNENNFVSGTLNDTNPQDFASLQVNVSEVFHFIGTGSTGGSSVPTAMRITIYDSNDQVYYTFVVHDGETRSVNLLLQPGAYTFRFAAKTKNGAPMPDWNYSLMGANLSDPIGPLPIDPTGDPGGGNNGPPFVWGIGKPTGDSRYGDPWW